MSTPWYKDESSLRACGFTGFMTIGDLRACKLSCVPSVPGVYVILRTDAGMPTFLAASTGGRFKGRDPNVALDVLAAKWVPHSQVVYVGKAGPGAATLKKRLRAYLDFGSGKPTGHWGGRYIWHLPDSGKLVVCWKPTPGSLPRDVEQVMIRQFREALGALPFANLVH
jgi:hypothetical protein